MKKIYSSLLALVAIVTMSMSAGAAVTVRLVDPAEGAVTNPGHFPDITVNVGDAMEQVQVVTMSSDAGESVECPWAFDFDSFAGMVVDCSKVTKSGKWTLTIPAGALDLEGESNDAVSFSWDYTNPDAGSGSGEASALTFEANAINVVDAATVKVPAGGSFENTTGFPNINFTFSVKDVVPAESTLTLTSDKGYSKAITLNHMFYDMGYSEDMILMVGNENVTESGVYSIELPEGFFSVGDSKSAAQTLSWTYTNPNQSGPVDDGDLVVNSLTIGSVDILTAKKLADIAPGTAIKASIKPIPEAVMLKLSVTNKDNGEAIRNYEIYDIPTNPDVNVDPAAGVYSTKQAGKATTKFYVGSTYNIQVTAYSSTNANNPANTVWGPVDIEFEGETVPYQYSPVTVVSVEPSDGFEVTDPSQPVVITFSAPVAEVTCSASTGGQAAVITDMDPYMTASADKTVWTVRPGASFWNGCDTDMMFDFTAKDDQGLVVKGNQGVDAGSFYRVTLGCFLAWPEVALNPASGMVEELYSFTVENSRGINMSYNAVPYVVDAAGNQTKVDMNDLQLFDPKGRNLNDIPMTEEVKAVKMIFHLTQAITEPGAYTFVAPRSTFAIGTEYDGEYNRYQETAYTVVKMPKTKVNVELVNFAKAQFEVLSGRSATVNLTPAADWKLASLKLGETDVTADVVNNAYTIADVEGEEVSLVATYEFAHEVQMIESSGILSVGSKEVKVYNENDNIVVEGVAEGDVVKIYTVNGMLIGSMTATQDVVKVSCPAGQVYVVLVNDAAVKIKH